MPPVGLDTGQPADTRRRRHHLNAGMSPVGGLSLPEDRVFTEVLPCHQQTHLEGQGCPRHPENDGKLMDEFIYSYAHATKPILRTARAGKGPNATDDGPKKGYRMKAIESNPDCRMTRAEIATNWPIKVVSVAGWLWVQGAREGRRSGGQLPEIQ
ncbi:hypothetical protein K438DRAFT_1777335 [Mycena galopus ATCC 62051]|nr:hypothetical protein K438DRAFT_1777335 [Mycena galopus ATCC 62051]